MTGAQSPIPAPDLEPGWATRAFLSSLEDTSTSVAPAGREPLAAAHGSAVACQACELDFDAFTDPGEAQHFAGVHNDLHGHGRVTGAEPVDLAANVDEDGW